ncbi:protease inhibitor EpiC1 [Phytophthora infestans T30-4]|uniref:Cystatin-like cysteine protease inhibitor EPIC1 n=2 Tax=Phytophthora infestans TaxID=4787 RepID=EPIC1_PHYIT|nr:protease inhibitor EpiC1 [Phytophthora infestans T30-4]A1L015.1 RecName: Full=Cystatin-like cysteine protease inhibitor EPIC1; AltName: Full=Extracellular protease inhibitor with cystatin-like domain protein 1; AltName: Full=Secreted effector EPIC1; Flags: Precursor [Phytophthora infestans]D0NBV1.1 RecName: Full=Cystatin-like cysteine protease inhibitor EPIC1; AltName: Full=Extracellular protease inhibitor with cystatin-like domain protein 1; AltName: Full=Secreted effector EPIC1; Flags: Precu|eukprot:XP_002903480.1 protease inhibitor EpiC1 [Phytophthora infestans T30-4]
MTFLRPILALLAATALVTTSAQVDGGYSKKEVTPEDMELLQKAQSNVSAYNSDVTSRICYLKVDSLETQVVSGENYKFHVSGCSVNSDNELGGCANQNCESSKYDIVIYSQSWTNTLEVTSITPVK